MSDSGEPLLSPYQRVLGAELTGLHPRLRAYFSAIPVGSVGVGEGTWDKVGSPRRWLWPVLWVLEKQGVAFPVWAEGVPFGVRNAPVGGPARPAVEAERTFRFPRAERVMVDSIGVIGDELVDRLGPSRRYIGRRSSTAPSPWSRPGFASEWVGGRFRCPPRSRLGSR